MSVIKYKDSNGNYRRIEVPTVQRAVMPSADSMPVGAVVQYTGATTGDFVNGYFYKVIETSTTEQVTYIGYRMGSLYFSKKQGQTDGYFYSVPSSSATPSIRYLPKWTPLDGTHWVDSSGNVYNSFEEAPENAQCSIMPYVSDPTTSTTWTFRMKQGSSYTETIQSNLDATTNAQGDGTREETVVTKTWQQINIQPSSAGEAESYNDLTDKPAINGHTLGGSQTNAILGIGERMDFSTTEREVGTWIDDNTIYEKVIEIGNLPNNNTKRVAHGISYDKIIYLSGMAGELTLPTVSMSSPYAIELSIDSTDIVVKTGVDRSSYTGFVIVRYTKTTV